MAADEEIARLRAALSALYRELWATYGDTPRLRPLFDQADRALERPATLRPSLQLPTCVRRSL